MSWMQNGVGVKGLYCIPALKTPGVSKSWVMRAPLLSFRAQSCPGAKKLLRLVHAQGLEQSKGYLHR